MRRIVRSSTSAGEAEGRPRGLSGGVILAAALAAAVVLLTFAVVLSHHGRRLAATNSRVAVSAYAIGIGPGQTRCQGGEYLPADAADLKLYPGVTPGQAGPPLVLTFSSGAGAFTTHVRGGYGPDALVISLPRHHALELARLCITNEGPASASFAGNYTSANPADTGARNGPGERPGDEVRADYFLAGRPSWLSLTGTILGRAALFRPGVETPAVIAAILALMVVALVVGVVLAIRELSRPA